MGFIKITRRVAANRRNAKKSTGPRTIDGKARSRKNALKHGLTAKSALLPTESHEDFDAFIDGVTDRLAPSGPLEGQMAERIAIILWRLRRVPAFEAALYTWSEHYEAVQEANEGKVFCYEKDLTSPTDARPTQGARQSGDVERQRGLVIGRAIDRMFSTGVFDKLARYDASLQRALTTSLKSLSDLKAQRPVGDAEVCVHNTPADDAQVIDVRALPSGPSHATHAASGGGSGVSDASEYRSKGGATVIEPVV